MIRNLKNTYCAICTYRVCVMKTDTLENKMNVFYNGIPYCDDCFQKLSQTDDFMGFVVRPMI